MLFLLVASALVSVDASGRRGTRRLRRGKARSSRSSRGHRQRRGGNRQCRSILLSSQCRKPADKSWCLQPMSFFTYADVKRAGERDVGLLGNGYSTARFARLMSSRDGPLASANLHHFILHKGNRYGIRVLERTGKFKEKLEYLFDKDLDQLGLDWSSCAVVGSSESVLRHERGKEIDGHSAVIRFNEAPTAGFEKFVGKRTTVRLQNPERAGFAEGKELCLTKQFSNLSSKSCKIVPLSPQFIAYSRYYWLNSWNAKPGFTPSLGVHKEKRVKMSTGFIGVALAAHLCSRISIYGFEAGAGQHYYNKTDTHGLSDWRLRHPWQLEQECLGLLKKNPRVKLVS
ncbi:sialyltransferase [Chloropicon primus]|uniref:beta-galactoside alpha-(2,6)-sialyltransferase n=1 Tax=Chloropicon primus TaxID=1764295 RepID=A0A5B8MFC3_9CHLO|nr:sialyltransferase [Chloropicon primus]UPQ98199.1 sialyltransferase [Chloropicon primus]|eukprot:QDZ18991.1 sialyltransferase [Chloropicon primus]